MAAGRHGQRMARHWNRQCSGNGRGGNDQPTPESPALLQAQVAPGQRSPGIHHCMENKGVRLVGRYAAQAASSELHRQGCDSKPQRCVLAPQSTRQGKQRP